MAILASAQWWVRAGGNALNGGGFDAAIAGAGTNYCDQDAAQLSLTDFATPGAGSTTLTSATGGFTSQMVGNCIRIASGTNFQAGYYFVTVYTDANTVTLDRTPTSGGAGSGGTGRLGGAFASVSGSLSTGGSVTAPTLASPLAAGHTINVRGGGTDTPGSADYTQAGYATYPVGSPTIGTIRIVGYNGRPRFDVNNIFLHDLWYWHVEHLLVKITAAGNPTYPLINHAGDVHCVVHDVRFDQAGFDNRGCTASNITSCEFVNTGSTAAGSYSAIYGDVNAVNIEGCFVSGWRGSGIVASPIAPRVSGNIIANCGGNGIELTVGAYDNYSKVLCGNTIYGCAGDGIHLTQKEPVLAGHIANNLVVANGGYGINCTVGTAALNDQRKAFIDYNAFYDNTTGTYSGISAGDNDITLSADPFTNAAGGDFTLNSTAGGGADLKNVAFPTSIP